MATIAIGSCLDMEDKYQAQFVIDPFSLLIVDKKRLIKRLTCPFFVLSSKEIGVIKENNIYTVEMVMSYSGSDIQFKISGLSYSHSYFNILTI